MEVKDLKQPINLEGGSKSEQRSSSTVIDVLFGGKVTQKSEAVRVQLSQSAQKVEVKNVRSGSNQILTSVNALTETTSDLETLVKSLSGILDQANETDLSSNRVQALQNEANQLVDKIGELTTTVSEKLPPAPSGGTDEVRKEVERRIGRTLDAIFGDETKKTLTFGHVSFSKKEQIIESVAKLEEARRSVEKVKSDLNETRLAISNVLNAVEVASANTESAASTVRDVDQAVDLASQAKINIAKHPKEAIDSAANLNSSSLGLLE